MNFVCVSPHFPPNYHPFCTHLRNMGVNVFGLADEPYEGLRPELKHALTEYYKVSWMQNYDEMLRAVGYFTHCYGKIDRLESHNEFWLDTDARLRTDFNIPGIKLDQLAKFKRKSEMKKVFSKTGVAAAPGKLVHNLDEAVQFAAEMDYPLILKPDIGVGANRVSRINTLAELEAFFSSSTLDEYLIEPFIAGNIFTFDGLTDQQGKIVFSNSLAYSEGMLESLRTDNDIFFYTLRHVAADIEEAGRKLVKAFDVRERFFHFEFFRTPTDQLLALEVNLRPPGGTILDMLNFANDLDLFSQYAKIVVNNCFDAPYSHPYHVAHVGRKFNKTYAHTHEKVMGNFASNIVQHGFLPEIFSPVMGNYFYLVRSADEAELTAIADYIRQKAE